MPRLLVITMFALLLAACTAASAWGAEAATPNHGGGSGGSTTICHATGSASNPFVLVTSNGNGHSKHSGDVRPGPNGCPRGIETCHSHGLPCQQIPMLPTPFAGLFAVVLGLAGVGVLHYVRQRRATIDDGTPGGGRGGGDGSP